MDKLTKYVKLGMALASLIFALLAALGYSPVENLLWAVIGHLWANEGK